MSISFSETSIVSQKIKFFLIKIVNQIFNFQSWYILIDTAEIRTMSEKASWDPANSRQKNCFGLENRKKISLIIFDYLYLIFPLLFILWYLLWN